MALERSGIPCSFDDCSSSDTSSFSVIIDSGASLAISPCETDFIGTIKQLKLELGGMADGMAITGKGEVEWTFSTGGGKNVTIRTLCYLVPASEARLLSPQRLFNRSKGVTGRFVVEQDHCTLEFDRISPISIDYNSSNWLPTATSRNPNLQSSPSVNLSVTSDENQNLSPAKKRLLHWYARFGHRNLRDV